MMMGSPFWSQALITSVTSPRDTQAASADDIELRCRAVQKTLLISRKVIRNARKESGGRNDQLTVESVGVGWPAAVLLRGTQCTVARWRRLERPRGYAKPRAAANQDCQAGLVITP